MSDDKKITVERTIQAPTSAVFDVLSNPERHAQIDGAGFGPDAGGRRTTRTSGTDVGPVTDFADLLRGHAG